MAKRRNNGDSSSDVQQSIRSIPTEQEYYALKAVGLTDEDWDFWFRGRVKFEWAGNVMEMRASDFVAEGLSKKYWQIFSNAFNGGWRTIGMSGNRGKHPAATPQNPIKYLDPVFGTAPNNPRHPDDLRREIESCLCTLDDLIRNAPPPEKLKPDNQKRGMQKFDMTIMYPALKRLGIAMLDRINRPHPEDSKSEAA